MTLKDNIIFIFKDDEIADSSKLAMIIWLVLGIECFNSKVAKRPSINKEIIST